MKIILDRQKLAKILLFIKNSIPKKEIEPILNSIYFKTLDDGKVQLVSTDLDLMAVGFVDAVIEEQGEVTIPGNKFISLVSKLSGEKIVINQKDTDVDIICGTYSGKFKTSDTASFPEARKILSQEKIVSFKKEVISSAFKRIKFAVNQDEARKNLLAVQITKNGMVATNGKVTALFREAFNIEELYISSNSLNDLISVVDASSAETIEVYEDEAYLIFKLGEDIFFTRKTSVKFPDVFNKIDAPTKQNNTQKIKFKVKDLKSAISRISLTSSEDSKLITLKVVGPEHIEISAQDSKGFSSKETITLLSTNVDVGFEVNFNYEFILEILGKYASEDIEISLNPNIRMPARIEEEKFTCLLMQLVG